MNDKTITLFTMLLTLCCFLTACAPMKVNTLPDPPATTELRIYFQPVSGLLPNGRWATPHEEFVRKQASFTRNILKKAGYYQLVSQKEVAAAIGKEQLFRWDLEKDSWELARKIGRAVHADYVLVGERGAYNLQEFFWSSTLINVETGKVYGGGRSDIIRYITKGENKKAEWNSAMREAYREIFNEAKADLMSMAIKKKNLFSSRDSESPEEKNAGETDTQEQSGAESTLKIQEEERQAAERIALEKAEQEQSATEALARRKQDEERRANERIAREKAESERIAAEELVRKKMEEERRATDRIVRENAERERLAAEELTRKKQAEERQAAEGIALEIAERERIAAEELAGQKLEEERTLQADLPSDAIGVTGNQDKGKVRVVVYDLESAELLRPIAMILSEALREELIKQGRFELVNRENLSKVLQELELRNSGLMDEKQAVQLGKGVSAREVVTGRLGSLGKNFVLQAKRISVESFRTISIESLKSSLGEEDNLLDGIPGLAGRLGKSEPDAVN
jgi:hypothetical protein